MTKSILLVGVGGQGTILASKILTTGLMEAGYDVKMSEIHGMSQRGGSVSSQVRYGDKVYSPVIEKGSADIIVSFEKMEALRNLDYRTAATLLGSYGDYNSALALASSGYDEPALAILSAIKDPDARSDYLEAILLSRLGEFGMASECFRRSVAKDPSMRHRANLDPEMAEVLEHFTDME